ncbi:single-stranded-DNA-specific exonuclease RecJ, partial [Romeria aff. gracilis LEGE 07310]
PHSPTLHAEFHYSQRRYTSALAQTDTARELRIQNPDGHTLIVQLPQRQGYLCLPGATPELVDVTEPYYYNLIRAGLMALEVKQKTQLLIKKDELLSEKDSQIETLSQQVRLLEAKINQLSTEQQQQFESLKTELEEQETAIQGQEAHISELQTELSHSDQPPPDPQVVQRQVRETVGDSVWFCIQPASQKDLCAAYKNYQILSAEGPDMQLADYSEAGIRLSFAVEREVVQPFLNDLYDFLLGQGQSEIGGIQLSASRKYTLGMVPSLLADQWQTLRDTALKQQQSVAKKQRYSKAKASKQVGERDRALLAEFFDQWEHPMGNCFAQKGRQAAASIDQINKLRNISAHAESFLYEWQYELLRQLIVGSDGQGGLFRTIYGG